MWVFGWVDNQKQAKNMAAMAGNGHFNSYAKTRQERMGAKKP